MSSLDAGWNRFGHDLVVGRLLRLVHFRRYDHVLPLLGLRAERVRSRRAESSLLDQHCESHVL
jgi:hypothetical protein